MTDIPSWQRRLDQLAALPDGWDPDIESPSLSSEVLEAARDLMQSKELAPFQSPAIFATEGGGLSIEWMNSDGLAVIGILPAGGYELTAVQRENSQTMSGETTDAMWARVLIASILGAMNSQDESASAMPQAGD
mgnify:CR=1 FL=1